MAAELNERQRFSEAIDFIHRALAIQPHDQASLALLGLTLHQQGELAAAEQTLRHAASMETVAASTLVELGNVLQELDRYAEAITYYELAVQQRPDYAEALFNWAHCLGGLRRPREGIELCRRAVALRPDSPQGLTNLGVLLQQVDQVEEAVTLHRRAIELRPDYADAWSNLAPSLYETGHFDEGFASCERALALDPSSVTAHINRAVFLLASGNFVEGWSEYEYRLRKPQWRIAAEKITRPKWDGSPLDGRHLLLIAEQGLGDTLQFIRYAALLRDQGAQVSVVVPRRMLGILTACPGVTRLLAHDDPWPEHDVYCELMSVCQHLTRSIDDIPAPIPYLIARPELVDKWREELAEHPGFRIGIAWQGSNADSDYRRVPVEHFERVASVPGVRLISLQADGASDLRACGDRFSVLDFTDRMDREHGAFQDTAAIMMNCDLIISSDTSVPHLAGALGRPVWMTLRLAAEWRWLRDRTDTPWYPTMKLFRLPARGAWASVFDRMAAELESLVGARAR